ncbi:MAG: TonB-dependent receptor plug domain-containing protein, partial [Burkholderiaceae bacterium]
MSPSSTTSLRCLPALGLTLLAAPTLHAQDVRIAQAPTVTLERVEVSGQRDQPIDLERESATASRLGLSLRDTPAAVEVLDRAMLQKRGLRSVTEVAQGAVGVLAGDFPAEPSAFSMRGFANSQINMLY